MTLAARFEKSGGSHITVTLETARIVGTALRFYADAIAHPREETGFTVDLWNAEGAIIETLARTAGVLIAIAAFDQACTERRGYRITIRQGIRLVRAREAEAAGQTTQPAAPETPTDPHSG